MVTTARLVTRPLAWLGSLLAWLCVMLLTATPARAEGIAQIGLLQALQETNTVESRLGVDILFPGEWINVSACGQANADQIRIRVLDPGGATIYDSTAANGGTPITANVPCNDPMTGVMPAPARVEAPTVGRYEVLLDNLTGTRTRLNRYDVTVTGSQTEDVYANGAGGRTGRISSRRWNFWAGSFAVSAATDTDYFVLTPGGKPNSNYVWKLDFNNMAGFGYQVVANGIGVDDAPSFSVEQAGNSVTPRYDLYLYYPAIAEDPPETPPSVTDFRFLDNAGQDITFSPGAGNTVGVQDTGFFYFETDTADATFAIAIDTGGPGGSGPDGVYGGEGDVFLNGYTSVGTNSAEWDGTDVLGNTVAPGNYTAQISVRLGEFHFVGADIETSGGTVGPNQSNGLTVWEMTPQGAQVPTLVYYDDESVLNGSSAPLATGRPTPAITLPNGAWSGTPAGYHSWGNFDFDGFGNERYVDTFVYGRTRTASSTAVVSTGDGPPTGTFTGFTEIDATTPGGPAFVFVSDADLVGLGPVTARITNVDTGDFIDVTLTEDPNQAGTFRLFDGGGNDVGVTTTTGATTASELGVSSGDTLRITYNDAANGTGVPATITDEDVVGGTDGVPTIFAGIVGDDAQLTISDADLAGSGTLAASVVNVDTGEVESVTLTETGPSTGVFTAILPTAAGTTPNATANLMNVAAGHLLRLDYLDALRENGTTDQTVSDNDTVKSGTTAIAAIDAVVVSQPVAFTVTDGDRAGSGSITATIENLDTGEIETVTLTERAGNPGLFDGTVATVYGTTAGASATDGILNADANDTFEIRYDDTARAAGAPAVASATDVIAGGVAGVATITVDRVGTDLTLTVQDDDLIGAGTLDVTVTNDDIPGEAETVTLIESATTPGLFEGTVGSSYSATANAGNGTIQGESGHDVTIRYDDAVTPSGAPAVATDTGTFTGGSDGFASIGTDIVGTTIDLEVTDPDLTGTSVVVTVTNLDTGETELVTLTGAAGSYTGTVSTTFGTTAGTHAAGGGADDGVFNAQAGDTFEIGYNDVVSSTGGPAPVTDTDVIGGGYTADPSIAATTVGEDLVLSVRDDDLIGAGTLTVTVTNGDIAGEIETVTLTESATVAGLFEGALATAYGTAPDGSATNGSINADAGDTLTLSVNDLLRADGSTGPQTDAATIAGGDTGVVTVAATDVGAAIDLTVTDLDLAGDGTVDVTLVNGTTGESESVTLTESATIPGLFEGSASTVYGTGVNATAGTFDAAAGDVFTVTYADALTDEGASATPTATATVSGGATAVPAITATAVGSAVQLSLTDADHAGDGTLDVTVRNVDTGEAETVTLVESATTPGLFEGTIATAFGATADGDPGNGSLNADAGDTIEISYDDPFDADGATRTVSATSAVSGGATGVPAIAATFPGQPLVLTLSDADLPGAGTIDVTVRNTTTGEDETVTLTWDTLDGRYEGALPTGFGTAAGTDDDGTMAVQAGDAVAILYDDALRADGSTGTESDTATVQGGATGVASIGAGAVGTALALSVQDADLAGAGTLSVTVTNDDIPGESETVSLLESATTPGLFEGTLATGFGTAANAGSGAIDGDAGDGVTIRYVDARSDTGEPNVLRTASDVLTGGDTGTPGITAALVGDDLTLSLQDDDLAGDGTVAVTLTNLDTGEIETVTLTEGATPGTFGATVATTFGTTAGSHAAGGGADDGTFNAQAGDTFRITHADTFGTDGGVPTPSPFAEAVIGGGNAGTATLVAAPVGQPLQLTVVDPDLAGDGTLAVTVTNPTTSEVETVTLTESATTPGTFTGTLATAYGTTPNATAGTLAVVAGDRPRLDYLDAFTSTGGSATVSADDAVTGGTPGTVTINAGTVGGTATLSVLDADIAGAGTLDVTVTNQATGEAETVSLTESATTPGLFEGTVATAYGTTANPAAGTIAAEAGDTFRIDYSDGFDADGGASTVSATDSIGGGSTGVPTIVIASTGADADISLTDPDLAGLGPVSVSVENLATGETETVTLIESATPGVFTGTLPTAYGTTDDGVAGTIAVAAGNTLRVTYADALRDDGSTGDESADATVGATVTGTPVIALDTVGQPVQLTVTDPDLAGAGTLDVTLLNDDTGESRTVTLTESGAGIFTGSAATTFGTVADNGTAAFEADAGDQFTLSYADAADDAGAPATLTDTGTIAGGDDATLTIAGGPVGTTLPLSVTDADLSGDGTLSVTVTNVDTGESETVTLTETSPGTFTGTVATAFGTAPDGAANGSLNADAGDTIELAYTDALTGAGTSAALTDTAAMTGGATGAPTIGVTGATGTASLSVTDVDLSGDGTLAVTVVNTDTGESETVTLTETSPGTFTGSIATAFGTTPNPATGTMAAQSGDTFEIRYTDTFDAAGGTTPLVASATVGATNTGTPTITVGAVGDDLGLSVSDPDLAGDGTLAVEVTNTDTGEARTITLTETGPGTFTGTAATVFGATADLGTAAFEADAGDTFELSYDDVANDAGGPQTLTDNGTIAGGTDSNVTITAGVPGDPIVVSVTDADLAGDGTLVVTVTNPTTGETESLTLNETAPGTFAGSLPTQFGDVAETAAGLMNVEAGDLPSVAYTDAFDATGGTTDYTPSDLVEGGTDATLAVVATRVGDAVTLSVTDADIAGAGTLDVTLTNIDTTETETVTLLETGPGVFEGTVATAFGVTPDATAGTFAAQDGDTFRLSYWDELASDGSMQPLVATDVIDGGTTGTPSITAGDVGDPLALSVVDPDLSGTGTLVVVVTNTDTGEAESVTLAEGPLGTFTGSLPTAYGTADNGAAGTMAVAAGHDIELAYDDALDADGDATTWTAFGTVAGGTTGTATITAGVPGDPLVISVTDADIAGDGTLDVDVENPATGEIETVTLTETSPGTFEGTLATAFGTAPNGAAGTINVAAGDTPAVTYDDAFDANGTTATVTAADTVGGGTTGTLVLTAGQVGEPLDISLSDPDLTGTGTVTVDVTNPATAETETVTLTEGPLGTFTGSIGTVFGTADDGAAGTIAVAAGQPLEVSYDDGLTDTGGTTTVTETAAPTGGTDGTVAASVGPPGTPIAVTVVDADLAGTGPITVEVVNGTTGETETVTLTETSPGTFEGTLPTGFGTADDGVAGTMAVAAGDPVTVTYDDPFTATGGTGTATDTGTVGAGRDGTLVATGGVPGDPIGITVEDDDLIGAGTLDVTVVNPATGETETVTLAETSPGTFEGTLPTTYGTADDGVAGTMAVAAGDAPVVTYDDALTATGGTATVTDAAPFAGGADATVAIDATTVAQPVTLSVTDADLAGSGSVTVTVTNRDSLESETVTLTENAGAPGTFEGQVATVFGFAPNGTAGTFAAAAGDRFEISYTDPLGADGSSAVLTAEDPIAGGAGGSVAMGDAPVGDPLPIVVVDADLTGIGSLDVTVTNPATGETETVTLLETSPGTFSASLPTAFGTTDDGVAGTLAVAAGDAPVVSYVDALSADGSTQTLTATAAITGGTDGVPTVAAPAVGDPLALTVGDPDIAGAGTLVVTVTNGTTGEVETVTLTETSPGTFEGTLPTAYGTADDGVAGTIAVAENDPITLTYDDAFRGDGSTGPITATAPMGGGNTGTIAFDPGPVGSDLPIVVVDADLAGTPAITVVVANPATGGTETVTLTVDPTDPTRFTGVVTTVYGTVDDGDPLDGALPVEAGVALVATYEDNLSDDGSPLAITDDATPTGGTDAVVTVGTGVPGGGIPITVVDPDLVGAGTITVSITNPRTGETELVVLTEDPANPGAFTGDAPTVFGPDAGGDGTLGVEGGDTVVVSFDDPFGTTGGTVTVDGTGSIGSGVTAVVTVDPRPVGEPTPITVVDPDLGGVGTVTVEVGGPGGGTTTITLVEDPGNPGTFTGEVETQPGGTPTGPGTIVIEPGDPITVTFEDPFTDTGSPGTVVETRPLPNLLPVANDDTAGTAPGTAVSIPVLSNDADPEGLSLIVTGVTQPATGGTVTFSADGTVIVTPDTGFTGQLTFTYDVADPQGGMATASVTVTVDADAPTAVADSTTTAPGTPVTVTVLDNDIEPNGGTLTVTAVSGPVGGTVAISADGTTVEFTPTPGFEGEGGFTYEITGPTGLTDTATVSVTVDADPVALADDAATTPFDTPVVIDLLGNDDPGAYGPLVVSRVTQGADGVVTFDPATGGATYDPASTFYGTDTFTYEACDALGRCHVAVVTVTVEPPLASITGIVWRDLDHDRTFGIAEPLLPGWGVEIVRAGVVVASTQTDAAGGYRVDGLEPGGDYAVRFLHPETAIVWEEIDGLTLVPGTTTFDQSLPVDPSGVVYDAVTRAPIAGATVAMTTDGGVLLPAICMLDPSQQSQVTGADGYYRFDIVPGADPACPAAETAYRLTVAAPDGTAGPSATIVPEAGSFDPTGLSGPVEIVPSDDAPTGNEATTYYLAFSIAPGDPDVVNNHLPLDVTPRTSLLVTKTALRTNVSAGEAVPYRITLRNSEGNDRSGITLVDLLPPGFTYQDGSSTIDGARVDARVRGRTVEYRDLVVPANGMVEIALVAVAGSAIQEGEHVNRAWARDLTGEAISNIATATVRHEPDADFDCSTVIGRVFLDTNDNGRLDAGEEGLPNVRLATVDGVLVRTGRHGRYHLPCAAVPNERIGSTFVLKLDERTLPLGFAVESRNPQTVRLTRGKMSKVNFAVRALAEVRLDFSAQAFSGLSLKGDHEAALAGLVDTLLARPSRLRLVYHARPGEIGGRERMRALARRIEGLWKRRGAPYELSIERTVERSLALGAPRLVTKG